MSKRSTAHILLLVFWFVLSGLGTCHAADTGLFSGQFVVSEGVPLSEGIVFFYNASAGPPPDLERYWRVPEFFAYLDEQGGVLKELPEGSFYLAALKRASGERRIGPPEEGDLFLASLGRNGVPISYSVKKGARTEAGTIGGVRTYRMAGPGPGGTAVEGVIRDQEGNPVKGALVYAYTKSALSGKPRFVSRRSDAAGNYRLGVDRGGEYYLGVRGVYGGGPPRANETVSSYGKNAAAALVKAEVREGATASVDLSVVVYDVIRGRKAPEGHPNDPRDQARQHSPAPVPVPTGEVPGRPLIPSPVAPNPAVP